METGHVHVEQDPLMNWLTMMAAAETDASVAVEKLVATTMRQKKGTDNNQLKAAMVTAMAPTMGQRQTGIDNNQLNVVKVMMTVLAMATTTVMMTAINNKSSKRNGCGGCCDGGCGRRGGNDGENFGGSGC